MVKIIAEIFIIKYLTRKCYSILLVYVISKGVKLFKYGVQLIF